MKAVIRKTGHIASIIHLFDKIAVVRASTCSGRVGIICIVGRSRTPFWIRLRYQAIQAVVSVSPNLRAAYGVRLVVLLDCDDKIARGAIGVRICRKKAIVTTIDLITWAASRGRSDFANGR